MGCGQEKEDEDSALGISLLPYEFAQRAEERAACHSARPPLSPVLRATAPLRQALGPEGPV